jgi:hypothetical protein
MAMNYNYDWLGYTCSDWVVGGWKCTADIHIVAGKMTTVNIPQKPTKHNLLVTGCQRLRSMYIYMCTHTHIYIYTDTHNTHTYIYICTSYISIYTSHTHTYTYTHTHIYIYLHIHTLYIQLYMHLHANINTHLRTFQHDLMPRDPMVRRLDFAWGEELQRFPAEGSDACGESTQGRRDRGLRPLGCGCSVKIVLSWGPCLTYFKHF